jgi:hypothetical protein
MLNAAGARLALEARIVVVPGEIPETNTDTLVAFCGMTTDGATVDTNVLSEDSVTVTPPAGAGDEIPRVTF